MIKDDPDNLYSRTFTIVIPARYQSARLPGKPLLEIAGRPMIQHVYERARQSRAAQIIVATDDQRIGDVVNEFGGSVCMTRADHASGTDRICEVVAKLQLASDDIVVNVQGDEPLIPPAAINQVAANLGRHLLAAAATLSETIESREILDNPNTVKVVTDARGYALYFSRAPIPFDRDQGADFLKCYQPQRHIGLYAFRVSLLNQFARWSPSTLESIERLEQLRVLENGEKIHVDKATEWVPGGIDTLEDYMHLKQLLKESPIPSTE